MYPLDQGMWGPTVRISRLRDELARLVRLDVVSGDRRERRRALLRYALSGRLRGLAGIYVENSSRLPTETDLAFLALARLLRIGVLTYVRDAQYLFEEYFAATSLKRRLARAAFLPAIGLLRAISSRVAYPSRGLAAVVRDRSAEPMLLPPGSPDPVDVPRASGARDLLFVGHMRYPVHGLDLLIGAVERVREAGHDVGVICVSRAGEEPPEPRPGWMRVERGGPDEIRSLLPAVIASIQPRHRSPYNDLAVPVKVLEYLAYGRPLVVTDCVEQAAVVRDAGAGVIAAATPEALAAAIVEIVEAPASQLERWSANAMAAARANAWSVRARTVVTVLESLR
jgi:glycosyltransferase involved in cell wall biosynthesis